MTARARATTAARLAGKAVAFEAGMWRSLYRFVFRRPRTSTPEDRAFGYARVVTPVLLAFIGVSAVELPVLHLLLPWPTVRLVADILSAYALLWMIGLLASLREHPHVVGPAGLRVRSGISLDMTIPWDFVLDVRVNQRTMPSRPSLRYDRSGPGVVLQLVVMSQTNVDIVFRDPTTLPLASGESEPLAELRIGVDDPGELVAAARRYVAAVADPVG